MIYTYSDDNLQEACKVKVYVEVLVRYTAEGQVIPLSILWEDGHRYQIDQVKSVERCASRKAGGCGLMYTCIVQGKETHLYYEDDSTGRWFLERKAS